MDAADEMDIGGQVRQDASTAIGAVTEHDDLVIGEPPGRQVDEFQGQFRSGAMIGIALALAVALAWVRPLAFPGLGRFPLALLPLGEPLAVDVQPGGDGQGEDLGGRPEGVDDDQTEDDPVVSPTDQGLGPAGDERVVVHAGAVEGQAALATEGVIDGPEELGARGEDRHDQLGQGHGEGVDVPGGMAEEAMESRPVAVADVAAGEDDFGDEAVALGEDPAGDDRDEGLIGGCGEDRGELAVADRRTRR